MPRGQLYINGQDAYTTWGVSMDSSALSVLMTPAEKKDYIQNESALEHGSRVVSVVPKLRAREIVLGIHISAPSESQFLARYAAFVNELNGGEVEIETAFQSGVVYHCLYVSCQSFSEYRLGLGKFILKLYEPNPTNRSSQTAVL